jgi:hypothetical protein
MWKLIKAITIGPRLAKGYAFDGLGPDERQQISVDSFGFRRRHTVREASVGFQRAILEQFGAKGRRVGIGYDLIIVAVHHQCRDRDLL